MNRVNGLSELNALLVNLAIPEIFMLSMACLVLLVDAFYSKRYQNLAYLLSLMTLVGAFIVTFMQIPEAGYSINQSAKLAFHGLYVIDPLSTILKCFILAVSFVVLIYSRRYLLERTMFKGEYFVLALFAVLGMMVMVSAAHFLSMYLGLELLSLSMYAMVAMQRDSRVASEAAMKYFVLGAIASGMLLYGMAMIYGATGSLEHAEIRRVVNLDIGDGMATDSNAILLVFGLVFLIAGIAFKLGAAPFHMWAPDVYQGAPTSVTLFIGTAPKLAGFALTYRILVDGLGAMGGDWQQMLMVLATASIVIGNVIAISQTNIKRMLAYSTIAHMGYMMLGLIAGTSSGFAASLFYNIVYTLMTVGAFGVIILLSHGDSEAEQLTDFKGLAKRSPWFAFVMLIFMFSMAGVPPFIGFWSKWFVLKELVAVGHIWLAAVAVFFAIIGAYYYLRVIRLMYFDKEDDLAPVTVSGDMNFVLSLNGITVLLLGLMPGALLGLCITVIG